MGFEVGRRRGRYWDEAIFLDATLQAIRVHKSLSQNTLFVARASCPCGMSGTPMLRFGIGSKKEHYFLELLSFAYFPFLLPE